MKKSLRRKLLLSGLAMGVAALSLASTTYAWFSSIDSVDANEINVNVNVPTSLLIKHNVGDTFGQSATLNADEIVLTPTTPVWDTAAGSGAFYKLNPAVAKQVKEDGKVYDENNNAVAFDASNTTYFLPADANVEYFQNEFYLKYEGVADETYNVLATFDINGKDSQAINDDIKFVIYEKGNYTTAVYSSAVADMTETQFTFDQIKSGDANVIGYDVYVWLEGTTCKNSDINTLVNLDFDITFKLGTKVGA